MKMNTEHHRLLTAELDEWSAQGRKACLWIRDDDASTPGPQLDRLLKATESRFVPMLLAVIPELADADLAAQIGNTRFCEVAVHGIRHQNHAPAGEKSQELGPHRPATEVTDQLRSARQRLARLMPDKLTSILVPPWNRIAPDVTIALPGLGFDAISTFGAAKEAEGIAGLVQLNTHLDIIDWKGTRGGRDPDWLTRELVRLLCEARGNGRQTPVGVLTHHIVHDDAAWAFLDFVLDVTANHAGAEWYSASQLTRPDKE